METEQWVSVSEAARRYGVSRPTIQTWMKRGKLQHRQDNRGNPQVLAPVGVQGAAPETPAKPLAPESPSADALAIKALEKAIAELTAAHHRQLAVERRRGELLAAELARPLTLIERIVGRRIPSAEVTVEVI